MRSIRSIRCIRWKVLLDGKRTQRLGLQDAPKDWNRFFFSLPEAALMLAYERLWRDVKRMDGKTPFGPQEKSKPGYLQPNKWHTCTSLSSWCRSDGAIWQQRSRRRPRWVFCVAAQSRCAVTSRSTKAGTPPAPPQSAAPLLGRSRPISCWSPSPPSHRLQENKFSPM